MKLKIIFKHSNLIVVSSRNLDYFQKYLVLFVFYLLVQLKQITSDNVPLKNSPMTLNIISLSQGIESVSSTYRNTFLQLLDQIKSESQILKEKYDKIVKCEEGQSKGMFFGYVNPNSKKQLKGYNHGQPIF